MQGKAWIAGVIFLTGTLAQEMPIFDAHIHYSQNAWSQTPPERAIEQLRKAGIKKALVSSSPDDGTLLLYQRAPDLIVPALRPYRQPGDTSSWLEDAGLLVYLEERLKKGIYKAIGEFHVNGALADSPIMRGVIGLAKRYNQVLQAHSDADAVERMFKQEPSLRILWAHAGFASAQEAGAMVARYPNLYIDLALRTDIAVGGKLEASWQQVIAKYPERILLGTDTWVPSRWTGGSVGEHASWARSWLKTLSTDMARKIATENAERLFK
jgi:hypothetical protein